MTKFSKQEKETGKRLAKKLQILRNDKPVKWPVITFSQLEKYLKKEEKDLIEKILLINPRDYGKKGKFYGIRPVPKNLTVIRNQEYISVKGKKEKSNPRHLPKRVYQAFLKLNQALKAETGRQLFIRSGYRSPAYQLYVFLYHLTANNWHLRKTMRGVALPGYSEHGYPIKQGVDLNPVQNISDMKHFYKTKEYKWLLKNASKFGFYLSFPAGNKSGTMFEPWHWHYEKK